ncbi:hypothetical protein NL676_039413 [Syzygium grande]|nr:hypothetical protein NL676_039413 [Syzygium grande]
MKTQWHPKGETLHTNGGGGPWREGAHAGARGEPSLTESPDRRRPAPLSVSVLRRRCLKDAFEKFGHLLEAKVVVDKFSGRSRGFGFVTFDEKQAMEEAIEAMNGMDLDGRNIIVEKAQPQGSVLAKGAEEVSMGGGMTGMEEEEEEEEEVVVGAMVLIEMVIDLAGAIGIVVPEEDREMTAIVGTVLVPMNVVVQETSARGRNNTPDRKQLEVLLLLAGGVKVSSVASLRGCLGGRIGLISL